MVPYFLAPESLALLQSVRSGAKKMAAGLSTGSPSPRFDRDFVDLCTWIAIRQAHTYEAAAWVRHQAHEDASATAALDAASLTWQTLHELLATIPELSILDAAREAARTGELSDRFIDSFWANGCDFYGGYPLVTSPEAIELVYLPQLARLRQSMTQAERAERLSLEPPGWFWHDFPNPAWADAVRRMPSEDAGAFELAMRERLIAVRSARAGVSGPPRAVAHLAQRRISPAEPSTISRQVAGWFVDRSLFIPLPSPLAEPPPKPV